MDDTTLIAVIPGLIALLWTMYQQYALNKICQKCPFRLNSIAQDTKTATSKTTN